MVFHKPFIKKSLIFAAENRGTIALVAKLVDAPDLGSGVVIRVGSSPIRRTMGQKRNFRENFPLFLFSKLAERKVFDAEFIVVWPKKTKNPRQSFDYQGFFFG